MVAALLWLGKSLFVGGILCFGAAAFCLIDDGRGLLGAEFF